MKRDSPRARAGGQNRGSDVDFALLGHQESWGQIARMVRALRDPSRPPIPDEELRQMVPWIPPRTLLRSRVASFPAGRAVRGIYVETFITPDELEARAFHRALEKVMEAIACAAREGARVAALGGFTSIVLEERSGGVSLTDGLALTTGNTLTSAFIVKGIESAAALIGIDLTHATLLIVGSTGDIGSACATYLGQRVKRLLLSARNPERLRRQEEAFRRQGVDTHASSETRALLGAADVVVCAASLSAPAFNLADCRPGALVCDAGYPKNLRPPARGAGAQHVFWGGMGQVLGGWESDSPLLDAVYAFPAARVAHGCLLEGMVLAMAQRYEPFSRGRGRITLERMEEIWALASRHGIVLAPFFGPQGLWPEALPRAAGRVGAGDRAIHG